MKKLLLSMSLICGIAQATPQISNATVRLPLPGKTVSAGYFSINNSSNGTVKLLSATSPQFDLIELHNHINVDGMLRMVKVEDFEIAPHTSIHLQPGGYHLMLFRPKAPLTPTTEIDIRLKWSDGSETLVRPTITEIPKK